MAVLLSPKAWVAIAFAALLALVGLQQVRVSHYKAQVADVRAELANDRTRYAQAAQAAEQAARAEEARRTAATQKVIQDAKTETAAAVAAADAAGRAADGLRSRVAALVAAGRGAGNPSPAGRGSGEQGGDPIGVLAGLLERVDARQGVVAAYADRLRVAGAACERWAGSLTP